MSNMPIDHSGGEAEIERVVCSIVREGRNISDLLAIIPHRNEALAAYARHAPKLCRTRGEDCDCCERAKGENLYESGWQTIVDHHVVRNILVAVPLGLWIAFGKFCLPIFPVPNVGIKQTRIEFVCLHFVCAECARQIRRREIVAMVVKYFSGLLVGLSLFGLVVAICMVGAAWSDETAVGRRDLRSAILFATIPLGTLILGVCGWTTLTRKIAMPSFVWKYGPKPFFPQ